jgi:hypothetical protein
LQTLDTSSNGAEFAGDLVGVRARGPAIVGREGVRETLSGVEEIRAATGAAVLTRIVAVTRHEGVRDFVAETTRRWGRITVKQLVADVVLSNGVRSVVSGVLKTLTHEYGPYNVLVNSVVSGHTATARQALTGRVGRPEAFAGAAVFLAGERAGYTTGVALVVDGGIVKGLS